MKILDVPQSGSVAGVTASRNRFGQYKRTRAIPVQPRTPKQTFNRSFLTVGSSGWRQLSDAQRTAWNDYAAQITRSDRLGSGYTPTGASLYTGAGIISGAAAADPPAELPDYVLGIQGVSYTDPTPGPEALNATLLTTSANNFMIVDTSGPVSPGLMSAAAIRNWRSLPGSALNRNPNQFSMSAVTVQMLTQYNFLYPTIVVGQVIWFRFREIAFPGGSAAGITNKQWTTFRFVVA